MGISIPELQHKLDTIGVGVHPRSGRWGVTVEDVKTLMQAVIWCRERIKELEWIVKMHEEEGGT